MKWHEAYEQMKDNKAFVRRSVWGHGYMIWLKPVFFIQEDQCKDENLKKLIHNFGGINEEGKRILKGEEAISIFNGYSIEAGWWPRLADKVADDWEIVNLK